MWREVQKRHLRPAVVPDLTEEQLAAGKKHLSPPVDDRCPGSTA